MAWIASADIRPLVAAADALVAVGTKFNQAMTHDWSIDLPPVTIRIDVDSDEIERNLPMQHKLVGDGTATLEAINNRLAAWGVDRKGEVHSHLAEARVQYRATLEAKVGSTRPWAGKQSLFTLGLHRLGRWLHGATDRLLAWNLTDWDAPNWSAQITGHHARAFVFALAPPS